MKNKSAFTLLEILLSITFVTVVFTAITGLILMTLRVNAKNKYSLQASYLAQEGLEVMRYIRDSNWLQNYTWDEGEDRWGANFSLLSGDKEKEFYILEKGEAYWMLVPVSSHNEDDAIVEMSDGFQFKRKILISFIEEDALRITAVVSWDERGGGEVSLSTILTNWQ